MHLKPTKSSREAADADPLIAICGGGGVSLYNSVGNAWTADYLKITGELDVDLRSNIAAEARAKIVYERLIDFCDDSGSKDALQFLMTREITHMKAFMTALAAMEKPPLAIGLIKPSAKIVDQYFNTSTGMGDQGEQDLLAPWNDDATVERIDAPAFQEFADPMLGTRRAEPIEGPDLSSPTQEAAQPMQMEHAGEGATRKKTGHKAKSSKEKQPIPG
jgi:Mn-containing catalase